VVAHPVKTGREKESLHGLHRIISKRRDGLHGDYIMNLSSIKTKWNALSEKIKIGIIFFAVIVVIIIASQVIN
jgi:hypothetical protein